MSVLLETLSSQSLKPIEIAPSPSVASPMSSGGERTIAAHHCATHLAKLEGHPMAFRYYTIDRIS